MAVHAPVDTSHTLAVPSSLPVTRELPSGEGQTEYTSAVWPTNSTSGELASQPSQRRAVPSWLAVTHPPGRASTTRRHRTASPCSRSADRERVHCPLALL